MTDGERSALRTAVVLVLVSAAGRWVADRGLRGDDPLAGRPDEAARLDSASERKAADDTRRARPLAPGERIDANRAPEAELDRLPGVGPALAAAWIAHRAAHGGFTGPDDLADVRGIGPATAQRLGPLLQFSGGASMLRNRARRGVGSRGPPLVRSPSPIDLNAADSARLVDLPGIGPALAGRILDRRRRDRFRRVDDLLDVRGIGPATLERIRERIVVR